MAHVMLKKKLCHGTCCANISAENQSRKLNNTIQQDFSRINFSKKILNNESRSLFVSSPLPWLGITLISPGHPIDFQYSIV